MFNPSILTALKREREVMYPRTLVTSKGAICSPQWWSVVVLSWLSFKMCLMELLVHAVCGTLQVDPAVPPVVSSLRKVSEALKPELKQELSRLISLVIITPADQPTDWVNLMAICSKTSGGTNLHAPTTPHPSTKHFRRNTTSLPIPDDILLQPTNIKVTAKVDLKSGYWHIALNKVSSILTTFQTLFGRYRWCRLLCHQRVIKNLPEVPVQALEGLPGVHCIVNDGLIAESGDTIEEAEADLDRNVHQLPQTCWEKGIKLNREKCPLSCASLPLMGHMHGH